MIYAPYIFLDRKRKFVNLCSTRLLHTLTKTATPLISRSDFDLRINDKKVDIQGLEEFRSNFEAPVDDRLDQVKKLVAQLHSSLNVTDHQVTVSQ